MPECDVDGCQQDSDYLLTCGERCAEHAAEAQPKTVAYCRAVLADA